MNSTCAGRSIITTFRCLIIFGCGFAILLTDVPAFGEEASWSELIDKGTQAESEEHYASAIQMYTKALAKSNSALQQVRVLNHLITAQVDNHELKKADDSTEKAMSLLAQAKMARSKDCKAMIDCLVDVANVYKMRMLESKDAHERMALLKKYVQTMSTIKGSMDSDVSVSLALVATRDMMNGLYQEAAEVGEEHIAFIRKYPAPDKDQLYLFLGDTGGAEVACGQYAKAEENFTIRHQLYTTSHNAPSNEIDLANYERNMGAIAFWNKNFALANKHYEKALLIHTQRSPTWKDMMALDFYSLGAVSEAAGNTDLAIKYFNKCIRVPGATKNDTLNACLALSSEHLASLYSKQGKSAEAKAFSLQAKKIRSENPAWTTSGNATPEKFFSIWGFMPHQYR